MGANKLSGFVANKLSYYDDSLKGGFHDLDTDTTGDTDNEIRTSLYRMVMIKGLLKHLTEELQLMK